MHLPSAFSPSLSSSLSSFSFLSLFGCFRCGPPLRPSNVLCHASLHHASRGRERAGAGAVRRRRLGARHGRLQQDLLPHRAHLQGRQGALRPRCEQRAVEKRSSRRGDSKAGEGQRKRKGEEARGTRERDTHVVRKGESARCQRRETHWRPPQLLLQCERQRRPNSMQRVSAHRCALCPPECRFPAWH